MQASECKHERVRLGAFLLKCCTMLFLYANCMSCVSETYVGVNDIEIAMMQNCHGELGWYREIRPSSLCDGGLLFFYF